MRTRDVRAAVIEASWKTEAVAGREFDEWLARRRDEAIASVAQQLNDLSSVVINLEAQLRLEKAVNDELVKEQNNDLKLVLDALKLIRANAFETNGKWAARSYTMRAEALDMVIERLEGLIE